MNMSIGIDLGTTNTVVSIARRGIHGDIEVETEKITQISDDKITPVSDELLPSVLYVEEGIPYVGQVAKAMKSQNRKRVISNSKNFMGLIDYQWDIDGIKYTPEAVASHFLKASRKFLQLKYGSEESLTSAVITVPASFDIDQKRATKTAARLAGFDEDKIILISEPTAAMLDFINQQRRYENQSKFIDFSKEKKVLVFDLGGGTCDVAVLNIKIAGEVVNVEEVAVSPHTLVGGTNFDMYAVLGVIEEYNKLNRVNLEKELGEETFKDLKYELAIRCEKAKLFFTGRYENLKHLSEEELNLKGEALKFPISVPNILKGKAFDYDLTMKQYNKFIEPLLKQNIGNVDNIINPILEALKVVNLEPQQIEHVFCVGGMTMYPAVAKALKEFFKKEPVAVLDRMNSVSRGAAVFHYYKVNIIEGGKEDKYLEDKLKIDIIPAMPQSVFLNVKNGFPITLIEAGTKAGTPMLYDNLLKIDSELGIELELYGGRSFCDPKLKKLRSATLEFPRGIKRGANISLKVEYTDIGILNFEAWLTEEKNVNIQVCLNDLFITKKEITDARSYYKMESIKGVF